MFSSKYLKNLFYNVFFLIIRTPGFPQDLLVGGQERRGTGGAELGRGTLIFSCSSAFGVRQNQIRFREVFAWGCPGPRNPPQQGGDTLAPCPTTLGRFLFLSLGILFLFCV